ncbi:Fic family protein [Candidatus Nomurabacteria bacterium]|nr:Fic family protein [Candidatus Nomurabacteria bacterium]
MDKFNAKLNNIPPNIILKLSKIDELKGRWTENTQLSYDILNKLKKATLVTSTGASTRIEGSEMTDDEVENYMRGMEVTKLKDRDKQEVKGYFEILKNVFDSYQTLFLREGTIQNLHRELMKYSDKDKLHLGEYKTKDNKVALVNEKGEIIKIIFDTTPPYLTKIEMNELIDWTRNAFDTKNFHPLLIIAVFIIEFLCIHPFEDGNGRMSRILTNLLLLQNDYSFIPYISHEKIIEENKNEYYLSLRQYQKNSDNKTILPWITFFLTVIEGQAIQVLELAKNNYLEFDLSPVQIKIWNYINEHKEAGASEMAKIAKLNRATVNQALQKLMRLKKIKKLYNGPATKYRKI